MNMMEKTEGYSEVVVVVFDFSVDVLQINVHVKSLRGSPLVKSNNKNICYGILLWTVALC